MLGDWFVFFVFWFWCLCCLLILVWLFWVCVAYLCACALVLLGGLDVCFIVGIYGLAFYGSGFVYCCFKFV